ncbi:MAG: PAS domain S-box protein [Holophagaceae bacterium]|nr:PAS domain S-box protein [Holophagaceae bacterium]
MTGPENPELSRLQARLQQVAGEKATLHLVLQLIERLNPLAKIDDMLREVLRSIMDTIGGTNIKLYYWEAGDLHYLDFLGSNQILAEIDDPLARRVAEQRTFIQQESPFEAGRLLDGVVPVVCSWGYPLLVEEELIGIVTLENLHLSSHSLGVHLPVFFHHTALMLSNELRRRAREAAEEALGRKSEELDSYFNNALDLFAIADTEGFFRKLNPSWTAVLGHPLSELEGAPFLQFVHPDDLQETLAAVDTLVAQKPLINFVNRYRHRDGSWRWIEWRCTAKGNVIYAAARDITEQKASEEALRAKDRALDASLTGIAIADLEGRLTYINPAFLRIWGYRDPAEVLGRSSASFWQSPEQAEKVRAALNHQLGWSGEMKAIRRDGIPFDVEVSASFIPGKEGAPEGLVAAFQDITERKRAEDALRESQEMFSLAFRNAPMLLTLSELDSGDYLEVNEAFLRVSGFERQEILGHSPVDLGWMTREDRAGLLEQLGNKQRISNVTLELHAKHGRVVTCLYSAELITIEGRLCLLATSQDISALLQAQESVKESEARLRAIFESSQDAIGVAAHGLHEMVNPAYLAMFGFDRPEELLGTPLLELIAPESRAQIDANMRSRAAGEFVPSNYEVMARRRDGSTFRMEIHAASYEREGCVHTVVSLRDITERRLAEERLRDSEARYASITENSPVGIYRFSDRRGGLYYSPRVYDLLGFTAEDLLADPMRWHDAIHPEDQPRVAEAIAKASATCTSLDLVYRVHHASGEERWLRDRASCHQEPDGELIIDGVALDVTEARQAEEERKRLQSQLLQSQKMESLGSLAGGVAHDMNNVLGAILGLASAHIYAEPEGTATHRTFKTIMKACERGGKMVKSLLSFARQSPAEERQLDVNALLREEVRLLERTTLAKVHLELDLVEKLQPVRGDAGALTHMFMNLCVNAVDAMPGGGKLTLRTRNEDAWVAISVEDTGSGMSPEILERALDPFFTTKDPGKGTGLGLSMAYSTVKAHHGRIELQSELGAGTCVLIHLPASHPELESGHGATTGPTTAGSQSLHLLLVDDDELIQSSIPPMLVVLGHRVSTARRGQEALALVERGLRPDAVILDMNMPGLSGAETLPLLRDLCPGVPVLLATGRTDQLAIDLVASHARIVLLPKPFDLSEVRQKLASLLPE